MKLSVVATLYQSAAYLDEFVSRCTAAARQFADDSYEIILVNDGSPDDSLDIAIHLGEADPHLTVVDLSRNFGHHAAMLAGLEQSRGDFIFLLDSDLEEQPEWLSEFDQQMQQQHNDMVFGVQQTRKGGWFERVSGNLFYRLMDLLSDYDLPKNLVTARLMTRRYVDALLRHRERELSIGGLHALTGFSQSQRTISKLGGSESTYTLKRKIAILVNTITSFSNKPLVGIFYIGATIFTLASLFTGYLVLNWLLMASPPSGWTSVIASIWLLGGLIISLIGIIAIYLSKIFIESKQRPRHIVRAVHSHTDAATNAENQA